MKFPGLAIAAALITASTPSPSPALDTVLAAPPAGFTELSTAPFHGAFMIDQYVSNFDASKRTAVADTMKREGFVGGYANTWVSQASQHVLVEVVFAFSGGRGARNWLSAVEVADKQLATYQHSDTLSGVEPSFGAHIYDSAGKTYADDFGFAKGNDVFEVLVVSTKDDALAPASAQAKTQYDRAPSETIPSGQWPENQTSGSAAYQLGVAVGRIFGVLLVIGVVLLAVIFFRRRSSRATGPALVQQTPGVQMSADGNYWWDGQGWRDAAREAPPFAQRSGDGSLWWDGRTWRPVPPPAAP